MIWVKDLDIFSIVLIVQMLLALRPSVIHFLLVRLAMISSLNMITFIIACFVASRCSSDIRAIASSATNEKKKEKTKFKKQNKIQGEAE